VTKQEQLDEIMDNFDFHKVQRVMVFLEWEYSGEGANYIPEESELRRRARKLLNQCIELNTTISTGGFEAIGTDDIKLSFVVEEYECWD